MKNEEEPHRTHLSHRLLDMSMCREDEVYSIGLCKILPLIQAMFHLAERSGIEDDRPQMMPLCFRAMVKT